MIGNARDAKLIRDFVTDKPTIRHERAMYANGCLIGPIREVPKLPAGWERVGGGCFRSAWLSPDGVIYKVEHDYGGYGQTNDDEHDNIVRILSENRTHPNASIPRTTLYTLDGRSVMAMEYIKGSEPTYCNGCGGGYRFCTSSINGKCVNDILSEIGRVFGLYDLHAGNVMYIPEQSRFVVIDIGA